MHSNECMTMDEDELRSTEVLVPKKSKPLQVQSPQKSKPQIHSGDKYVLTCPLNLRFGTSTLDGFQFMFAQHTSCLIICKSHVFVKAAAYLPLQVQEKPYLRMLN